METTRIDIDAYYKEVNDLMLDPHGDILDNDNPVRTLIVMRYMFDKAISDVKIFCGKFSIFRTNFQNLVESYPHYSEEQRRDVILNFQTAVRDFLKKGHRLIAVIEDPSKWQKEESSDSYFAQLFKQHQTQIELKTPTNEFYKLLGITHFYMAATMQNGNGAVRWEADEKNYTAIVSSSPKIYKEQDKIFKQINRYSVPI